MGSVSCDCSVGIVSVVTGTHAMVIMGAPRWTHLTHVRQLFSWRQQFFVEIFFNHRYNKQKTYI